MKRGKGSTTNHKIAMKEMGWKWKKWKRINYNWRGQKRNNDKKQHANVEEEKLTGKKTSKAKNSETCANLQEVSKVYTEKSHEKSYKIKFYV